MNSMAVELHADHLMQVNQHFARVQRLDLAGLQTQVFEIRAGAELALHVQNAPAPRVLDLDDHVNTLHQRTTPPRPPGAGGTLLGSAVK